MNGEFWSVGECMLEMRDSAGDAYPVSAAGDTFNTAVYYKRMLPGAVVRYVSALGEDAVSRRIRRHICAHGVDDMLVATIPDRMPGLYLIETDEHGERCFRYWRQGSAARAMLDGAHLQQVRAALPACGALLLTGITLAILDTQRRETLLALAAEIRRCGGWVIVDSNYRPVLWPASEAAWWMTQALDLSTHALLSFDDEAALYADADPDASIARVRRSNDGAEVVVKLGAQGCVVAPVGEAPVRVASTPVRAIDTTAAGDSFNAAYLAARRSGMTPIAAAEHGCRLAARVVAHPGGIIPQSAMEGCFTSPDINNRSISW